MYFIQLYAFVEKEINSNIYIYDSYRNINVDINISFLIIAIFIL